MYSSRASRVTMTASPLDKGCLMLSFAVEGEQ